MKKNYFILYAFVLLIFKSNAQTPQLFKDLYPGPYPAQSNPECFFDAGPLMYFVTNGTNYVHQLWKTDGTPANTVMVKDSLITTTIGQPVNVRGVINGFAYYTVELNGGTGSSTSTGLWKTDGTLANTTLITTLTHTNGTGNGGGSPSNYTVVGNKLLWSMGSVNGRELWVSDGTAAGTNEVINLAPGTISGTIPTPGVEDKPMIAFNGKLYFSGQTTSVGNYELYSSDGTAAGTVLAKEFNPSLSLGSSPDNFKIYNSELYILADDGSTSSSNGLWKTNGTIYTKVFQNFLTIKPLTIFQNKLFFSNGIALWKSDGTTAGTLLLKDSVASSITGATPNYLMSVYSKYIPTPPYNKAFYYKSDGTAAGTTPVSWNVGNSASFDVIGNNMYISKLDSGSWTNSGLWQSDGTNAGTTKLTTYGTYGFKIYNNSLYFQHNDTPTGTELWSLSPSAPAGINQFTRADANLIYPNPAKDNLTVKLSSVPTLGTKINFMDISGRKIKEIDLNSEINLIDISVFHPGIYFYSISNNGRISSTGKLIKE